MTDRIDKTELALRLVETATAAVEAKRMQAGPYFRRAAVRALHLKQASATERDLRAVLVPLFRQQVREMARKLRAMDGKAFDDSRRKWDESQHPREPAGTGEGGQFVREGEEIGEAAPGEVRDDKTESTVQQWALNKFGDEKKAKAFTNWFGDSKVVDDKGEPLVVYHGTNPRSAEAIAGYKFLAGKGGVLIGWFDIDAERASGYAVSFDASWNEVNDGVVFPVFLSIKNPKMYANEYKFPTSTEDINKLREQGYDGVASPGVFAVIDSTQIKSATGNVGTYDPDDPNINKSFTATKTKATASALVDRIFDPAKWKAKLIDRALPILAIRMAEAARNQLLSMGVDPRRKSAGPMGRKYVPALAATKTTTASEWLAEHPDDLAELEALLDETDMPVGILTELPTWMKEDIVDQLADSFEQPYWDEISEATGGDAERFLEQGLQEGWSIRRMADEMAVSFRGNTGRYAKMRATRIARTESGHSLNGARKGVMDRLMRDIPQVTMRPVWLSVLGTTTRESHAHLDGVPADEDGMWKLGGVRVPHPLHYDLPAGERINCLCSIVMEFGLREAEARQRIADYVERVEEMEQWERDLAAEAAVTDLRHKWDESQHPREPGGSSEGGQFTGEGAGEEVGGAAIENYDTWSESHGGSVLGGKLRESLADYQGMGYAGVNASLRGTYPGEPPSWIAKSVKDLDAVMEEAPALKNDIIVFRGLRAKMEWLKEGAVFTDNAFISASASREWVNKHFGKMEGSVVATIKVSAGVRALSMNTALGIKSNEEEILLSRGVRFRVDSVLKLPKEGWDVRLSVVD